MLAPEAAQTLLDAFVTQLETQGVKVPARRYVAPGQIEVWDDEQFVVFLKDLLRGQPGTPNTTTTWPVPTVLAAQFGLELVRPIPGLSNEAITEAMLPTEDALTEAGLTAINDAQELMKAGIAVQYDRTATEVGMGFALGPCTPIGPEGGFAATRLTVEISLD